MSKYNYDVSIAGKSQEDADTKMKAVMAMLPKFSTEELVKMANAVNNPIQLALIKSKLL